MKQKIWIILGVLLAVCLLLVLILNKSPKEKENDPASTEAEVVTSTVAQSDTGADKTEPVASEAVTTEAAIDSGTTEAVTTEAATNETASTEATAALIEDGGDVEIIIPDDQGSGGF